MVRFVARSIVVHNNNTCQKNENLKKKIYEELRTRSNRIEYINDTNRMEQRMFSGLYSTHTFRFSTYQQMATWD